MLKIAICEDSASERERLKQQLRDTELFEGAQYCCYADGKQLIEAVQGGEYFDIAFLDIDMPLVNGIEAAKRISRASKECLIIFVTAYPQYAIQAFDCNAFNYVLKNDGYDRLYSVALKAMEKYKALHGIYRIGTKDEIINLKVSDICYIECLGKHLVFHTCEDEYTVRGKISEALTRLCAFGFCQCHQGYIVNMEKITRIDKYSIMLDDGSQVPVSVRKRAEFLKLYNDYIGRYLV